MEGGRLANYTLRGDFNENVYTGRIAKQLEEDDIMMTEQCRVATGSQLPATFADCGTRAIDAVFATGGVEVINAGLLPIDGGVGDHRCFILDFRSTSVFGSTNPRVVPVYARKLNCDCERIRDTYRSHRAPITIPGRLLVIGQVLFVSFL